MIYLPLTLKGQNDTMRGKGNFLNAQYFDSQVLLRIFLNRIYEIAH
jgi:hypothetical protein